MVALAAPRLAEHPALQPFDPWRQARAEAFAPRAPAQPLSFREWITKTDPRFVWYDHCERLVTVLQRVVDGELTRVIIAAPPRHGKSEIVSRKLPAYYLYRHPQRFAAVTSYAADLAYTLSRSARDHYTRGGGTLRDDAAAVKHWETTHGGGLWATGFGGPATGKGFHLGIIDDPIKNAEEAASETIGRGNWDWYQSTFYTRSEPGAAIVVMQTRWPGPGDLIGRILQAEDEDDEPERWHVVNFEAIKTDTPLELPLSCTLEPDPRQVGEALCPERYPLERLRKIARRITDFFFAALFQQRPRARDGGLFPREKAKIVPAAPAGGKSVRYWDKAGTEGGGAYSAGVRMKIVDGLVYVEDVRRKQLGSHERNQLMRQTAELDGLAVTQWTEQEPGSGGKESAEATVRLLAGYSVHVERVTGDKVTRADPFAAQWQGGNVRLVHGAWNGPYLDEMEAAPHGKYKDQMDASSGAYNKLSGGPTTATNVPFSIV